jgi:hypothetical protein
MAAPDLHVVHAISIGQTVPVIIGGITDQDSQFGGEVRAEVVDGLPYSQFLSLVDSKPVWRFSTLAVETALTAISTLGLSITALPTGLIAYIQTILDGGMRAAGALHSSYTMVHGVLVPTKLSVADNGDAKADFEATIAWDGTNNPIVPNDTVDLPNAVGGLLRYGIGPVVIGGITLTQITGVDIDFGLKVEVDRDRSKSNVYPEAAWIDRVDAKITVRGNKKAWFSAGIVPLLGLVGTHANTSVYLRKRALGGTFVPTATIEHLQFTAAGMAVLDKPYGASGNKPGEVSITLTTYWDGTNAPIKFTKDVAIPV